MRTIPRRGLENPDGGEGTSTVGLLREGGVAPYKRWGSDQHVQYLDTYESQFEEALELCGCDLDQAFSQQLVLTNLDLNFNNAVGPREQNTCP